MNNNQLCLLRAINNLITGLKRDLLELSETQQQKANQAYSKTEDIETLLHLLQQLSDS